MIRSLLLLVSLGAVLPTPAAAQAAPDPFARMRESAGDPADRLAGYLRTLAGSPRDVEALTGAGKAALDVGDANAAIGFYARADGLSPKNGQIKAGLATALLRMGKAKEALKLFGDAVDLGVPEAQIASDRGLAYDLRGDPRRAQRDYRLALASGQDAETTRRLALSLGISGDRAGAIQILTPLLYRNDAAAWRARAFVLAMTGDAAGAGAIASSVMVPGQAAAMQPFFARLAALAPADKARAVHFGEMPSDGTNYSQAELAGIGASGPGDSYRPEVAAPRAAAAMTTREKASPSWLRNRNRLLKSYSPEAAQAALKDEDKPAVPPASADPSGRTVSAAGDLPVLALVAPDEDEARPAAKEPTAAEKRAAARKKAADEAKKKADAAKAKAEKANPERIWVQVAGGANKGDLAKAWTAAKAKSPDVLKGHTASTTKVRATNRVLIGPFKTRSEAQEVVNKLPGSFIVTTEKGQAVAKLPVK